MEGGAEACAGSGLGVVGKIGGAGRREWPGSVRAERGGRARSPYDTVAPASSGHDLIEAVIQAEATNVAATLHRLTPESGGSVLARPRP